MIRMSLLLFVVVSLTGCVGLGFTVSPADGSVAVSFKAQDCISDNIVGRTIQTVPRLGDWAMLHWGCAGDEPLIGRID